MPMTNGSVVVRTVLLALVLLTGMRLWAQPMPESVAARMDSLLRNDMFRTSQVALAVYDLTADSVLYAHNEQQLMRPASTMKLLTAIAAIDKLGGGYRLCTDLCYTGRIVQRTLQGTVYCVGGMDPRFNSDDMAAFVESLHRMGVDTLRGKICADKSMKEAAPWGEGWCWDDENPVLTPLLYGGKDRFMERLQTVLREAGIVVEADIVEGVKPDSAYCICSRFHTIDQILMRMMKESDNLYAEAMFYQLAAATGNRPATAADARRLMAKLLERVGIIPTHYRIADGSGLSLYNYVTAELEIALLRYAYQNKNVYLHLLPSLPIAGEDGTLKNRMGGAFTKGNVQAKTGSVMGVYTLAGYCTAANGNRLCFAIINQGVQRARFARKFQDEVCRALCAP